MISHAGHRWTTFLWLGALHLDGIVIHNLSSIFRVATLCIVCLELIFHASPDWWEDAHRSSSLLEDALASKKARVATFPTETIQILEHLEMFRYGALKQWVVAMRRPREELEVVWLILFWKIHLAFIAGRGTPDVWGHCSMLLPTSLFARMSCRWVGGQRH